VETLVGEGVSEGVTENNLAGKLCKLITRADKKAKIDFNILCWE
jgi:hypothetical protein